MSDKNTNRNTGGLAGLIQQGITNALKEVHTCIPGFIVEFNPTNQTAKVQIGIKRLFKGDDEVDLPQLINVPVWQPRAGGFNITFPIKQGDTCLILFSERSLDNWFKFEEAKIPNSKRTHDLSDGICLAGMSKEPSAITDYDPDNLQIRNEEKDQTFTMKPDKSIVAQTGNNIFEMLNDGTTNLTCPTKINIDTPLAEFTTDMKINQNLEVLGNTTLGSTVTSNGKDISDTHKHGKGDYKDAESRPLKSGESSVPS